jgi:hypothetical protein
MIALRLYMTQHVEVHGTSHIKPKHHWAFDVAAMMMDDSFLPDALIIERIHLRIRAIADNVKNTEAYERVVLSGVINGQVRKLQQTPVGNGLRGPTVECPKFVNAKMGDCMDIDGLIVNVDDYVFHHGTVGIVRACCADDQGAVYAVVDSLHCVRTISAHSASWSTRRAVRTVWRAEALTGALAWQLSRPAGEVVVICM